MKSKSNLFWAVLGIGLGFGLAKITGNKNENISGLMGIRGNIINKYRAQEIASFWHGGQWSALYQLSSSGVYMPENHLKYLNELMQALQPEYHAVHPRKLTRKEEKELKSLIRYIVFKGEEDLIKTGVQRHSHYGYEYPVVIENKSGVSIKPIQLPN